jgi:hypothetical protein
MALSLLSCITILASTSDGAERVFQGERVSLIFLTHGISMHNAKSTQEKFFSSPFFLLVSLFVVTFLPEFIFAFGLGCQLRSVQVLDLVAGKAKRIFDGNR